MPEPQDILRDGSGDLLMERFVLMKKYGSFYVLETVDKAKWTFQKPFRCADAQRGHGNDSQSFQFSFKKLSSNNNAHKDKAGPEQSKHICGKGGLLL